eukprot:GFUD01024916.1.p1 GENE.GFUD01024916.1~~GFUD01024916.1.p1  ORF type:complete len:216 (+),score=47.00 GFUD01024916.1:51-698(+)
MSASPSTTALNGEPPLTPILSDYVAVPGKIIPIPGTEFVLISPINPTALTAATCDSACTSTPDSPPPPPLSSQIKRRGRPFGKTRPCQCPNCQDVPGADRHLCHFANCGKTFTTICHLEAHLRNHMGARPYQCPEPGCGAKFVRPDELKRHSWIHNTTSRFICHVCNRRYNRADHFKVHIAKCCQKNSVSPEECMGGLDTREEEAKKRITGKSLV